MKNVAMFLCILGMSAQMALADTAGKKDSSMRMPTMTTEQRQKMAVTHEKMAACLRSDKPISDCHEEMRKACKETSGKDGCPMMGGKMGHGMHHQMMDEPSD